MLKLKTHSGFHDLFLNYLTDRIYEISYVFSGSSEKNVSPH
jgi:hypothetical protein